MTSATTFWSEIADLPHTLRYIQVGHWRTRVLEIGDGPETVLLLNGTSGHIEAWTHNIRSLAQRYRVVGYDYPGHGYTTLAHDDLEIPTYEEHLLGLLDTLGLERVHLMGESLGGWIGIKFAASHPDRLRSMVLSAPGGRMISTRNINRVSPISEKAVTEPTYENVKSRLQVVIHDPGKISDELVEVRRNIYAQPGFLESMRAITALQDYDIRARNQVTEADYAAISIPTLLVWTDHEPSGGAELGAQLAALIPNSDFLLITEAGHWPQWEDPAAFNDRALEFLAQHTEGISS